MNTSSVRIEPNQATETPPEKVEEAVAEHPWVGHIARFGWIAKGAVYVLMGLTAFTIGRRRPTTDDASPEGAVAQLRSTQFGTALIWALVIGLLLYVAWRLISTALIRGNDGKKWLERVGYLFSAAFYAVLAVTAVSAVMKPKDTKDKNSVERLSTWMLSHPVGRWALLVAGVVVIGIGIFFIVDKGLKKSFLKELDLSNTPEAERKTITAAGTVGWISRGVATAVVGFFVAQSAWRYNASDARGFDNAFRELATHEIGSIAVLVTGLALVVYGVFCVLIVRHLDLDKVS
jgi:magnesium-transporting ATPase (P-type)